MKRLFIIIQIIRIFSIFITLGLVIMLLLFNKCLLEYKNEVDCLHYKIYILINLMY
jgi:hypothetical protein